MVIKFDGIGNYIEGGEQTVDTAANGPAPSPWDVQAFAKEKFKDEKKICEVPHTASVQVLRDILK